MAVRALPDGDLRQFLSRSRRASRPLEFPLHEFFCETLRRANEFVPSMAGSILLDDSESKRRAERPELTFVATFGTVGDRLLGLRIAADQGVAGHVYVHGRSYVASDCEADPYFIPDVDLLASFVTHSLLAVPIRIERSICGVLELVNRRRRDGFSVRDLRLLEIFAGYLSSAIQNAVDTQKARELARRDDLTELGNDRALDTDLQAAVTSAREERAPLSLAFLDLDHFKLVNDTYGHLLGSRTLREVGAVIARNLPTGATAYRYGGDEFVVLMRATQLERALEVAEGLREAIARPMAVSEPEELEMARKWVKLSVSIGVATAGRVELSESPRIAASELLGSADHAMYEAKDRGRDRVVSASARKGRARVIELWKP